MANYTVQQCTIRRRLIDKWYLLQFYCRNVEILMSWNQMPNIWYEKKNNYLSIFFCNLVVEYTAVNKTLSELKQNKSIYSVSACMIHVKLFGCKLF